MSQLPPNPNRMSSLDGKGFRVRRPGAAIPPPMDQAAIGDEVFVGDQGRVADLLTLDAQQRAMLNPEKLPEQAGPFIMLMNMLTRVELELAALRLALQRRGLLTEQELLAALKQTNEQYDQTIREMTAQMAPRKPGTAGAAAAKPEMRSSSGKAAPDPRRGPQKA